ncbi:NfeD family protein [Thermococcus sp.]
MRKWSKALRVLILLADEIVVGLLLLVVLPAMGLHIPLKAVLLLLAVLIGKDIIAAPRIWKDFEKDVKVGLETLLGKEATVIRELNPEGIIKIGNEFWNARCINGSAKPGEKVKVVKTRGTMLLVERRE